MKLQHKLFFFLFITSIGSFLSSISSFLSIETYFHSSFYLSIALSLKTLAAAIFSYKVAYIIKQIGVKRAFIFSQVFGCSVILLLFLGFYIHNFSITLIGIMLSGIPLVLVGALCTFTFKVASDNELQFRKDSGTRELIIGLSMLSAAFLSPSLLMVMNLYYIFILDAISFIIGMLLLQYMCFSDLSINKTDNISLVVFKSSKTWIFIIQTTASLLLVAIIPIFASSKNISFTHNIPLIVRQWIWGIDALMLILASSIYLIVKNIKLYRSLEFLMTCNGITLILFINDFINNITMFVALFLISLFSSVSFLQFRDDYILSAKDNMQHIALYSGISSLQKYFVYFLSPLIVTMLFTQFNIVTIIIIVLLIQISAYFIVMFIKNRKFYGTEISSY